MAISWELLFARTLRVRVPAGATLVLVACTWLIYVADRLMDAARGQHSSARHRFYHTHRAAVLPVFCAVAAGTLWVGATRLPPSMFLPGSVVCALVALHLAVTHGAPDGGRRIWPKEFVVALVFALGVMVPVVGMKPLFDPRAPVAFVIFLLLCWINCVAIEHRATDFLSRRGASVAGIAMLCSMTLAAAWAAPRPLFVACAVAAAALGLLLISRPRLSEELFRVLADAALLSPLVILPFV